MCRDDLDRPEFWTDAMRYARKAHRCVECRRVINAGEFHRVLSGKWDGRMETHRTCVGCEMLGRWMTRICDNYPIGELLGEVAEHLREGIGGLDVARAYAAARRLRWRTRAGALLPVPARLVSLPWQPWTVRRPGHELDRWFTDEHWLRAS